MNAYVLGEIMKPELTSMPANSDSDNAETLPTITTKKSKSSRSYNIHSRTAAVGIAAAVIMTSMSAPAFATNSENTSEASPNSTQSDKFAKQVFDLMNAERRAAGVPTLKWNQKVSDVSQDWANKLKVATADPNFDWNNIHRADGGGSLIPSGAITYAEIIAFNFSAQQVVDWWMDSPSHKSAMLNPKMTDAGIGYVVPTSGPYKGWYLVVSNLAGYPKSSAPAVSPFSDLVAGQQFLTEMNWMHSQGISTGWTEANGKKTYRPFESVNRDAMAAFMYRLEGSPAFTPPKNSPFADVSTYNPYYKEITWLAAKGISTGWTEKNGTKTYRPLEPVNRDAMAAFMYRMAGSPKYTAPSTSPFSDVARSNPFYKEISWATANGITSGWDTGNGKSQFRPVQPVARDAMAAFMYRYAN